MASTADLVIALRAVDQASASLNNVAANLGKMDQTAKGVGPSFTSMAGAVGLGITAAGAFTAAAGAVVGGLQAAVKTSSDFGQAMANIKASVPSADFDQFGGTVQELAMRLGKDYPLSAADAGKAMEILAQKGISLQDITQGGAEAVVKLATATGADLRTGASIAAVAMDVFNVEGSDMNRVTDLMAGAMLRGGVTANDFGHAIQAGGTAVALAGGTIEDASIAIAAMAKAGIEGSDAGTSLKTMYMNLIPTTKAQKQVAEELGLITKDGANAFFDASGKVKSYEEISRVLADSLVGLTDKQKLTALEVLFGSDAIRAASVAASVGAGEMGNLGDMIRQPGIASEASAIKMDTLQGSMKQLEGSVETLALSIGEKLAPHIQNGIEAATAFTNVMIEGASSIDITPVLDAVGTGLSLMSDHMYASGQASSALGEQLGQIPVVGQILNQEMQIVGSVLTGVAAIMVGDGAAAAMAFGQALTDTGVLFQLLVTTVQDGWAIATTTTGDALSTIGGLVVSGWEAFLTEPTRAALADLLAALGEGWSFANDTVSQWLAAIGSTVSDGWANVNSVTSGVLSDLPGIVGGFFSDVIGVIDGATGGAASAAAGVGSSIVSGLHGAINAGVAGIAGAAANLVRAAINAARAEAGAQSPSRKMFQLGVDLMIGLDNGIRSRPITSAAQSIANSLAGVERELNDVEREAIATGRSMDTMGRDFAEIATQSATTGRAFDGLTRDLQELDGEDPNVVITDNSAAAIGNINRVEAEVNALDALAPVISVGADPTHMYVVLTQNVVPTVQAIDSMAPVIDVSANMGNIPSQVANLLSDIQQLDDPIAMAFSANVPSTVRVDGIQTDSFNANRLDADQMDTGNADMGDVEMGDVESEDFRSDDFRADDAKYDDAKYDDAKIDTAEAETQEMSVDEMNVDNLDADANARGGSVRAGRASIVGEEGPELVFWGSNGTVIPHAESMAMLSGGGVSAGTGGMGGDLHIHVYGDVLTEDQLLRKVRDGLIRMGRSNLPVSQYL